MESVNVRELVHHFSHYLKDVKEGRSITVLERNTPIADIVPHNRNVLRPGWKRPVTRRTIKGEAFSATAVRGREQER